MLELAKSKRIWAASLCASAYATYPLYLFPVYFVLIIFAIWTGRKRAISYLDAPRYGAQLALRVHTAISLVVAFRFNFQSGCVNRLVGTSDGITTAEALAAWYHAAENASVSCSQTDIDLNNSIRVAVFCLLMWIWITQDRRSLTAARIGTTALVAFAALLLNGALSPLPGSVDPNWTLAFVFARMNLTTIIGTYSEITFQVLAVGVLGYLLGHLCAPCLSHPKPLPKQIDVSFKPRENWLFANGLRWYQLIAGSIAALFLTAMFTAQNSALFDKYPIGWNYDFKTDLIGRFNYGALMSGLSGTLESLPFIAIGTITVWILGTVRLNGIIPILTVGAILGRLACAMNGPTYKTPFLTPLDSATLFGMIIAAGFGAVANACAANHAIEKSAIRSAL